MQHLIIHFRKDMTYTTRPLEISLRQKSQNFYHIYFTLGYANGSNLEYLIVFAQ